MTVPQIAGHSTGTHDRTRLISILERANSVLEEKVTLRQVVEAADGLEIPIVTTQGQRNRQVEALSWEHSVTGDRVPAGPYPARFKGTEALTRDGATSVINYLTATSPEAA